MLKSLILKLLVFIYKIVVDRLNRGKRTSPNKYIDNVYEIFENTISKSSCKEKIVVPYEEINYFNFASPSRAHEIVECNIIEPQQELFVNFDSNRAILPIALLKRSLFTFMDINYKETVMVEINNVKHDLKLHYQNRFHYLNIDKENEKSSIRILSANQTVAVGKPLEIKKEESPKLVVHLFIDALAQFFIDTYGYEIMPNTYKFFKNGIKYTNTYAQSEWTLTSMASVFTGKYTNEHLIFHPRQNKKIEEQTIAETFQNSGYTTFGVSGIPSRLTNINGFDKGFDRYIVKPNCNSSYIIDEAIEQMETFSKNNQYLFLSFFDVHEAHKLQSFSTQSSDKIEDFIYEKLHVNSKDTTPNFDTNRINRTINTIKQLDKKLKLLYETIDQIDKEATVIMHSDHGVNFCSKNSNLLSSEREKVIYLLRSSKTEDKIENNIMELISIPDTLYEHTGLSYRTGYDKREFAITESIYPNQDYYLTVRDNNKTLFFEVPWSELKENRFIDYDYKVFYAYTNNETESIREDEIFEQMLDTAKLHYSKYLEKGLVW